MLAVNEVTVYKLVERLVSLDSNLTYPSRIVFKGMTKAGMANSTNKRLYLDLSKVKGVRHLVQVLSHELYHLADKQGLGLEDRTLRELRACLYSRAYM